MILDDLKHIFADQFVEGTTKLYFMLQDGDATAVVMRHDAADLSSLVPMLDAFVYDGNRGGMPRFKKETV